MDIANSPVNALIAENIFVSFGSKEVLKGVAIRIQQHAITGLLGRNGSGKSTLLKTIFGMQKADDATLTLNSWSVNSIYTIKGAINYLPQNSFLPPARKLKKILADYEVSLTEVIAHFPELEQDIDKSVQELSGGSERLWAVIILLLTDTQYTLLDEPFSHIMPLHVDRLKLLMQQQKIKKGILITDHMYHHILSVSDSLYLMKEGKSLFIKDREDIVLHGYVSNMDALED